MTEHLVHKIHLVGGFKDKEGVIHQEVEFGRRVTVAGMMALDNDSQATNPTQYQDLINRRTITKFGSLPIPVPLNYLLELDEIDREDIAAGVKEFLQKGREGRLAEFRSFEEVKLNFGFEIDGTFYDVATFGNRLTGRDEVEADKFGNGVARLCFLTGRRISKLSTSDGSASLPGPIEIEKFNSLDSEDLLLLRTGGTLYAESFRFQRGEIS